MRGGGGLHTVYSLQIPGTKSEGGQSTPYPFKICLCNCNLTSNPETYIHMFFPFFVKGNGNTLFLSVDLGDQVRT